MKDHYDPWYVRLPDGRVIKAKSTPSIRHHIDIGHIPKSSMVRREKNEEWTSLSWMAEFADMFEDGEKSPVRTAKDSRDSASRPNGDDPDDAMELETVGTRGLIEELSTAVDSAIHRDKLIVGSFICALAMATTTLPVFLASTVGNAILLEYLPKAAMLLILSLGITWISRQTHWEMSRMRTVPMSEARRGSLAPWLQLIFASTIVLGAVGGGFYLANAIPIWLGIASDSNPGAVMYLGLLAFKFLLFQLLILTLLLGPIGPVEDYSFIESLRVWARLCAEHAGRILLFESLALVSGFLVALPAVLSFFGAGTMVGKSVSIYAGPAMSNPIATVGWAFMYGVVIGPVFVFITVANVILYLKLRYEFSSSR